jgi:GNAT superfamily N-acetyltransferase
LKIQDLKQNDVDLLADLQPEGWSDVRLNYRFYCETGFCFPIKATINAKIVGIGSTIIHNDVAWLGHIIVHPGYRNNGIGKLITQTLVESTQAKKCETIYLIATDLGAIIYEKLGFETETEYLFFKDIKIERYRGMLNNIALYTGDMKDQIGDIDKMISGEDRMCSLENHLHSSYVYKNGSDIEGFYLPSLGEGLIIAKTDISGVELMKLRLNKNEQAIFPLDNFTAKSFLSQNNYTPFRKAKRMRLGIKRNVALSNIYNRIGGNIG